MTHSNDTPPSPCQFCDIAAGRIRAHLVYQDSQVMAFLDSGPIRRGHVQIIPRDHYATFEDLPADLSGQVLALGQRIARAQKKLCGVERVAFLFTGGDIPHAHAHVVPMVEKTDITSRRYIKEDVLTFQPIANAGTEELMRVASALKDALQEV